MITARFTSTCPVLTQCRADVDDLTRRGCRPSGVVQAGHTLTQQLAAEAEMRNAA